MIDSRVIKLARLIVNYSINLKKGENVLIEANDTPIEAVKEFIKAAKNKEANVFLNYFDSELESLLCMDVDKKQYEIRYENELEMMKQMDAYIVIRATNNTKEGNLISSENSLLKSIYTKPVRKWRVDKTKWCLLIWPTKALAQEANMSTGEYEDYFFNACLADYPNMLKSVEPLVNLMNKTNKVHILGPGTDLEFSIKDIGAVPCCGNMNIPDGEVFSAPIRDSVNGVITYNTPTGYAGKEFENIVLAFKDGKIINANCLRGDVEELNKILDVDEGARYIGEFALGINNYINKPGKNCLFDEKIGGSLHFTPGACYTLAPNGNNSINHWDLILIQTVEYGGGEIWFDDILIRKDGKFIIEELKGLNPIE